MKLTDHEKGGFVQKISQKCDQNRAKCVIRFVPGSVFRQSLFTCKQNSFHPKFYRWSGPPILQEPFMG